MLKHFEKDEPEPVFDNNKLLLFMFQFCPFSRRVALTLSYHRIEHERVYVNIFKKPEWFLTLNPTGKVPMIEQDGQKLLDSEMICRYLDQLVDTDNLVRASDENSIKLVNEWWAKTFGSFHAVAFEKEYTKDQEEHFLNGLDDFEKFPGSRFISGDQVGLSDFLIYPVMELVDICMLRLKRPAIINNSNYPRINLWFQVMNDLPAIQKEKISEETHKECLKTFLGILID